jgi:hypothetical protein
MIPPLDPVTGLLPLGRYACTEEEVFARFVECEDLAGSRTRREIWTHWTAVRGFVLERIAVLHLWISGSFVTSKIDPDDLDVVWMWEAEEWEGLSPRTQSELKPFLLGKAGAAQHGLRIDSYAIFWRCYPSPTVDDVASEPYFRFRGYWDDLWARARQQPKVVPPTPDDARPRRGYLEVTLK